jgi:hypothetical protein
MKKLCHVLLFTLVDALVSLESRAQSLQQVVVKADMHEAAKSHLSAALEYRFDSKNSVEIQLGFRQHNSLPPDVFNGDWTSDYAERRDYIISLTSPPPNDVSGWEYLGTGRPLPKEPLSIIPLSTYNTRVNYGMSFQKSPRGFRLILLPGISVSRHRYFEVNDKLNKNETILTSWQIGAIPNQAQLVEQTSYYTQTRQMREQIWWVAGATYAFGFAWQAKCGVYLEARVTTGVNFGNAPYSGQDLPTILSNFYGQGAFFVGWAF